MADYMLTKDSDVVVRTRDGAFIPNDRANLDRQEYDKWVAAGGVPDPPFTGTAADIIDQQKE